MRRSSRHLPLWLSDRIPRINMRRYSKNFKPSDESGERVPNGNITCSLQTAKKFNLQASKKVIFLPLTVKNTDSYIDRQKVSRYLKSHYFS